MIPSLRVQSQPPLAPGHNAIKLFMSAIKIVCKKLKFLSLAGLFQPRLIFVDKDESLPLIRGAESASLR
jgi:hypothetical protein